MKENVLNQIKNLYKRISELDNESNCNNDLLEELKKDEKVSEVINLLYKCLWTGDLTDIFNNCQKNSRQDCWSVVL